MVGYTIMSQTEISMRKCKRRYLNSALHVMRTCYSVRLVGGAKQTYTDVETHFLGLCWSVHAHTLASRRALHPHSVTAVEELDVCL